MENTLYILFKMETYDCKMLRRVKLFNKTNTNI